MLPETMKACREELEKIGSVGVEVGRALRRRQAMEGMLPELLPGITAGLGAGLAAYYNRSPSAGAALGGSVGAIPFLLKGKK